MCQNLLVLVLKNKGEIISFNIKNLRLFTHNKKKRKKNILSMRRIQLFGKPNSIQLNRVMLYGLASILEAHFSAPSTPCRIS